MLVSQISYDMAKNLRSCMFHTVGLKEVFDEKPWNPGKCVFLLTEVSGTKDIYILQSLQKVRIVTAR